MLKEFREFALRGSVVDLAVGVIIGGAFGAIVGSLVNDVLMPPIGLVLGGVDFANLFIALDGGDYASLAAATEAGAATIRYGVFINSIINFLIIAFVLFLVIKGMNQLKRKEAAPEPAPEPAGPTTEERLVAVLEKLEAKMK